MARSRRAIASTWRPRLDHLTISAVGSLVGSIGSTAAPTLILSDYSDKSVVQFEILRLSER